MNLLWDRMSPKSRSRLIWTLWCVTWLLLLAGLFDRGFYAWVVVFSAVHTVLFLALFAFRPHPFPVQVRLAYLVWVTVGTWVPGMTILLYITTLGLFGNLFFGYCLLARCMSLMPWNRREPLSLGVLKRTFLSPPRSGPFTPPPGR